MPAGEPFWNAASQESKPLAVEDLQAAFDAVRAMPARRCPHTHPYSYVKRLRERGDTTARCLYCGQEVRL